MQMDGRRSRFWQSSQFWSKPEIRFTLFSVVFLVLGLGMTWYFISSAQQKHFLDQNKRFHQQLVLQQKQHELRLYQMISLVANDHFFKKENSLPWEEELISIAPFLRSAIVDFNGAQLIDVDSYVAGQKNINFAAIQLARKAKTSAQVVYGLWFYEKTKVLGVAKSIGTSSSVLVISVSLPTFWGVGSEHIPGHYAELQQIFKTGKSTFLKVGESPDDQDTVESSALNQGEWRLFSWVKYKEDHLILAVSLVWVFAFLCSLLVFWFLVLRGAPLLKGGSHQYKTGLGALLAAQGEAKILDNRPSAKDNTGSNQEVVAKNTSTPSPVVTPKITPASSGAQKPDVRASVHKDAQMNSVSTAALFDEIFRAYDIRGIVGQSLTPEVVRSLGRALGSMALDQGEKTLIIARDGRLSGPDMQSYLVAGILATGCHVIDIGMAPTPVLYFATYVLGARSGVMVTGSHNPPDYNGFKMVIAHKTLAEEEIQQLKQKIVKKEYRSGAGRLTTDTTLLDQYVEKIVGDVVLSRPLKIVIDCGNGVTGVIAQRLFESIGAQVVPLFTDVDGTFPNHHPDPSKPSNLTSLIAMVGQEHADIGLAFDGDGDRLGVVTSMGKMIFPDRLMMLLSEDLLSRCPGADIIFDIKCTRDLSEHILKLGGRPIMWKTGHSLIKAKLKETKAVLAGEMSGHIFYNDSRWYGFDDALYTAVRLLEIISFEHEDTHLIFARYPESLSTPEINIPTTEEKKFKIVEALKAKIRITGSVAAIDGYRVDTDQGWGLVRASNTTPNLVIRFEASNEEHLSFLKEEFRRALAGIDADLKIPF